jgi:proteic killer suppression protein
VKIRFDDQNLDRLETDGTYDAGFSRETVRAYRKSLQIIRNAPDERILHELKAPQYAMLKKGLETWHSLQLNRTWRLFFELEGLTPDKLVVVSSIENYH